MTEQMDHRAAIEIAAYWVKAADFTHVEDEESVVARCYLDSVRKAWPGVVPDGAARHERGHWWDADAFNMSLTPALWSHQANKFERDYPGLKVDEPFLVTVMEGVK
jgi:hypothetical protein